MNINDLKKKLDNAYSVKNLNNISLTLINLYKNEQYAQLQKITEIISEFVQIEITDNGKGFNKLIMLYHPDRCDYYRKEIEQFAAQNNFDALLQYSHILKLDKIEEIAKSLECYEDIDYSPVYQWDFVNEGFIIINDYESEKYVKVDYDGLNFYDAVKLRQYGTTDIEFPTYYLEDIDEFELSSSEIRDLEGVQFCKHAKTMDLSDNKISDLSPLSGLSNLEELNVSENEINDIDILSNLFNLKRLYLANNQIEDVSPLLELEKLQYVDLSGNKINRDQINELKELGVQVCC